MSQSRIGSALALVALLGCATLAGVSADALFAKPANAQEIDDAYFYTSLAPHGQWVQSVQFGWTWHPTRIASGWRPYTQGRWVWADESGWVWVSYEPWGWATYHYGRWYFDPYYGWSWVPGRVWAPAWVSWRIESGYVGWAPLWPAYFDSHPDCDWNHRRHDRDWDDRHHGRDWDRWVFTRDRDFTSTRVGVLAVADRRERDRIYQRSRDVSRFDEDNPERIGRSLDRNLIERATGRPIRAVRLEASDKPGASEESRDGRVAVFKPRVRERPEATPDRLGVARQASREQRDRERQAWDSARVRENGTSDGSRRGLGEASAPRSREAQRSAYRGVPSPRGGAGWTPSRRNDTPSERPSTLQRRDAQPQRPVTPSRNDASSERSAPSSRYGVPAERRTSPSHYGVPAERRTSPSHSSVSSERKTSPSRYSVPSERQASPSHYSVSPDGASAPRRDAQSPRSASSPRQPSRRDAFVKPSSDGPFGQAPSRAQPSARQPRVEQPAARPEPQRAPAPPSRESAPRQRGALEQGQPRFGYGAGSGPSQPGTSGVPRVR